MEYLIIFIEGIAAFISPCILPMLPIYIAYFAGHTKEKTKALYNSIGFVIGFTIIFVALGILTSLMGNTLQKIVPYIPIILGTVIILFGCHWIGIFKFKFLEKTNKINVKMKNIHFLSAILLGMVFALGWTPCVGVYLSSALIMVATKGEIIKGILMLFIFSMGLGIPFIISAVLLEKLRNTFEWIKRNYSIINKICGIFLIVIGILIIIGII